jgi:glycosyltransferase involved in cell wall biosynthesis
MKKISVLLPCYNSEKYIAEAVQSILDQTYTNFELIILDDGSTDRTKEIIGSFRDERIRFEYELENKGIVFQLNKGISLAEGVYIARMDADDISKPERFKKQIEFLELKKNNHIVVLGTDAVAIGESKDQIIHKNYQPAQISFLLNFYCPLLHPTVIMRKSVFSVSLKYSNDYKFAEDYALWRLIDNGENIAVLPEVLLLYRIHRDQTNKDEIRLKIQRESCLKISNIKSSNVLDNLLFNENANRIFVDLWFGFDNNLRINLLQKLYIRYMKKRLNIKSEQLIKLIHY